MTRFVHDYRVPTLNSGEAFSLLRSETTYANKGRTVVLEADHLDEFPMHEESVRAMVAVVSRPCSTIPPSKNRSPSFRASRSVTPSGKGYIVFLYSLQNILVDISHKLKSIIQPEETQLYVDESWAQFALAPGYGLTLGVRAVDWNTGILGNPSNLVLRSRLLSDDELTDFPLFVSAASILYPVEVAIRGAFRSGLYPAFGASASVGLGNLDLLIDTGWTYHSRIPTAAGALSGLVYEDGSAFQGAASLLYSIPINNEGSALFSAKAEFLFQERGWDSADADVFYSSLNGIDTASVTGSDQFLSALDAIDASLPGRLYASLLLRCAGLPHPDLILQVGIKANVADMSVQIRPALAWKYSPSLTCGIAYQYAGGSDLSHYGSALSDHAVTVNISGTF